MGRNFRLLTIIFLICGTSALLSCIDWSGMWKEPAPVMDTAEATDITCCSATLNGALDLQHQYSTLAFEWGTNSSYGQIVDVDQTRIRQDNTISAKITGLTPQTIYCYRLKWIISGSAETHFGKNVPFITLELKLADN